jgi:hypothetical protein
MYSLNKIYYIQILVMPSIGRIEAHFTEAGHTELHPKNQPHLHVQGE